MLKYKNLSDLTQVIPGVGEVGPGEIIESETELRNANLQLLSSPNQQLPPEHPQAPASSQAPVHGSQES